MRNKSMKIFFGIIILGIFVIMISGGVSAAVYFGFNVNLYKDSNGKPGELITDGQVNVGDVFYIEMLAQDYLPMSVIAGGDYYISWDKNIIKNINNNSLKLKGRDTPFKNITDSSVYMTECFPVFSSFSVDNDKGTARIGGSEGLGAGCVIDYVPKYVGLWKFKAEKPGSFSLGMNANVAPSPVASVPCSKYCYFKPQNITVNVKQPCSITKTCNQDNIVCGEIFNGCNLVDCGSCQSGECGYTQKICNSDKNFNTILSYSDVYSFDISGDNFVWIGCDKKDQRGYPDCSPHDGTNKPKNYDLKYFNFKTGEKRDLIKNLGHHLEKLQLIGNNVYYYFEQLRDSEPNTASSYETNLYSYDISTGDNALIEDFDGKLDSPDQLSPINNNRLVYYQWGENESFYLYDLVTKSKQKLNVINISNLTKWKIGPYPILDGNKILFNVETSIIYGAGVRYTKNDIYLFDIESKSLKKIGNQILTADDESNIFLKDNIVAFTEKVNVNTERKPYVYDINKNTFLNIPSIFNRVYAKAGNKLILIGDTRGEVNAYYNQVLVYDLTTGNYQVVSDIKTKKEYVKFYGNRIYFGESRGYMYGIYTGESGRCMYENVSLRYADWDLGYTSIVCTDNDNDGYTLNCFAGVTDCNDNNANINPGETEICGNNIDDNCDGSIDEGCQSQNGLVSWWKFDGNADDSISAINGFVFGSSLTSGKISQAYNFDGGFIYIPADDRLSIGDEKTISLWVKIDPKHWIIYNKPVTLVKRGPETNVISEYKIYFSGGNIVLETNSGIPGRVSFFNIRSSLSNDQQWHHIAGVIKKSTMELYIDGVLKKSGSRGENLDSNVKIQTIGSSGPNLDSVWGKIDEVKIWNRALSAQEILNDYNNLISGDCMSLLGPLNVAYNSKCGDAKYDLRVDFNKDKKIDMSDLGPLNANFKDSAWCGARLSDSVSPC